MNARQRQDVRRHQAQQTLEMVDTRLALGGVTVGKCRELVDPDGLVLSSLLDVLTSAPADADLSDVLARIGVNTPEDLWRTLHTVSSAAALSTILWAQDRKGEGPISLQDVVLHACMFRPSALLAFGGSPDDIPSE